MKEKILSICKTIFLIVLAIVLFQINIPTYADVGSFEDYSSGSDWSSSSSDWGSSSSDWSSSSSSWDWGSSSSSYDYGSSSGGYIGSPIPVFLFILVIVVIVLISKYLGFKGYQDKTTAKNRNLDYYKYAKPKVTYDNQGVIARIRSVDANFSKTKFESFVKETFIKLQNAWTDRDWEKIRPFETQELFAQHKAQLDGYIKNNQINVMDRICVNDMNLISFTREGEKDILVLDLDTRMADYIIDATTKQVIKGNKEKEYYHTYTLTFTRKAGTVTQAGENGLKTTNCPNCGAPTTITSSGRCEYCNSIITTEDHGWVLASLKRRN